MTRIHQLPALTLICIFAAALAGCGAQEPVLLPAKGIVTIGGQPAGNISVQFLPDVGEDQRGVWPTSYGITAEDGTFDLWTSDNKEGAVPGRHKLILVDLDEERPEQGKERTRPVRLDGRYAVAGTMTATVEPDQLIEVAIP